VNTQKTETEQESSAVATTEESTPTGAYPPPENTPS
jgi:hypothetical protein